MGANAISLGRQRERAGTKRRLTAAIIAAAKEVKKKMEKLIEHLARALASADAATAQHIRAAIGEAQAVKGEAEVVLTAAQMQADIADLEKREQKVTAFHPRRDWRPGGPDAS